MNTIRTTLAVAALISCAAISQAQAKKSVAETKLVGIKLYDSGTRVVQMYGTPDDIQSVNFGGTAVGPAGGGRGTGAPGAGGPTFGRPGGGAGGGGGSVGEALWMGKGFSFENDILMRAQKGGPDGAGPGLSQSGPQLGGPAGAGGGGARPGPGSAGGGAGMSSGRVTITRWIYNRGGSRYGFVLDGQNRVVQIEAIGLQNRAVRTRKGVGFGATFAELIKKYQKPDAYELNGDQIIVRFLSRHKVAFRLSRLGLDKPHVVTGIVVAAGKG
ncbi:MAG: hypothetical protein WAO58_05210 [Fimbriimonadaceae bacterium]